VHFRVSEAELGTPETAWLACPRLAACAPMDWALPGPVVVLAPHPDDEILAVGGTMRALARAGHDVTVVAVTEGEASHPRSRTTSPLAMTTIRARERTLALERLGVAGARVVRLRVPDGAVAGEPRLEERIEEILDSAGAAWCLSPWRHDGHPDHDATGRAAVLACARARATRLVEYPVWAWHWARPGTDDLPWVRARRMALAPEVATAKRDAISAYVSQIAPLGPGAGDEAVLPRPVLARFGRAFEVLFT
jgi:LmbE family N-acetylglucosaminyl deacetylase